MESDVKEKNITSELNKTHKEATKEGLEFSRLVKTANGALSQKAEMMAGVQRALMKTNKIFSEAGSESSSHSEGLIRVALDKKKWNIRKEKPEQKDSQNKTLDNENTSFQAKISTNEAHKDMLPKEGIRMEKIHQTQKNSSRIARTDNADVSQTISNTTNPNSLKEMNVKTFNNNLDKDKRFA